MTAVPEYIALPEFPITRILAVISEQLKPKGAQMILMQKFAPQLAFLKHMKVTQKTKPLGKTGWLFRVYFRGVDALKEAKEYAQNHLTEWHGGPGREFQRKPYIISSGQRAMVIQSGGLDI